MRGASHFMPYANPQKNKESKLQYTRKVRAAARSLGLCGSCRKQKARDGFASCESCNQYQRNRYHSPSRARAKMMYRACQDRAKEMDLPCNITAQWIYGKLLRGVCDRTGIPFEYGVPQDSLRHPFSPSVNRIDANHGYTAENCEIVLTGLNIGLSDWGHQVFKQIASAYVARA